MNEIDSMLSVTGEGVTVRLGDAEAEKAQAEEWLRTPEGSIYGWPSWGNPLQKYKHEPMNNFTEVAIENDMVTAFKRDLPHITLNGIRIEQIEKDLYALSLGLPSGDLVVGLQAG